MSAKLALLGWLVTGLFVSASLLLLQNLIGDALAIVAMMTGIGAATFSFLALCEWLGAVVGGSPAAPDRHETGAFATRREPPRDRPTRRAA